MEEIAWTKEDLQNLLAAMKSNMPKKASRKRYDLTLKNLDWEKISFQPFSSEECKQKCNEILDKIRKIRSLTELIEEAEDVIANPIRNQRLHPGLPKRPTPPNCLYYEEHHATIRKQHPELKSSELFKVAVHQFRTLSDQEKAPYVAKFELLSEEYDMKMDQFRKQFDVRPNRNRKKKKEEGEEEVSHHRQGEDGHKNAKCRTRKPRLNSYNLFCREQQATMTGVSPKNFMSIWARRWQNLSKKEKARYRERCREIKEEYKIKQKDLKMVIKIPCEPKMPPQSGAEAYIQEQMEVLKDRIINSDERMSLIKKNWRELPMLEKTFYREKLIKDKEKYLAVLQRWFKMLNSEDQRTYLKNNPHKHDFLQTESMNTNCREKQSTRIPSDSEDEELEDSSSEEEQDHLDLFEDDEEEEEDDGDITDAF